MSVGQRVGAVVVAGFAVVFTRLPRLITLVDPLMRRLLRTRLPAGPNVLLTVRGRNSGLPRTVPVAFVDLGTTCLLQAASHEVAWVRNVRASGEVVITRGHLSREYTARELEPEAAGRILHDLLSGYPSSRLVRRVVGPVSRPPIGVLHYFRIRVDSTLAEYTETARHQPLFELRHLPTAG